MHEIVSIFYYPPIILKIKNISHETLHWDIIPIAPCLPILYWWLCEKKQTLLEAMSETDLWVWIVSSWSRHLRVMIMRILRISLIITPRKVDNLASNWKSPHRVIILPPINGCPQKLIKTPKKLIMFHQKTNLVPPKGDDVPQMTSNEWSQWVNRWQCRVNIRPSMVTNVPKAHVFRRTCPSWDSRRAFVVFYCWCPYFKEKIYLQTLARLQNTAQLDQWVGQMGQKGRQEDQ